jgi:hypothetical protein
VIGNREKEKKRDACMHAFFSVSASILDMFVLSRLFALRSKYPSPFPFQYEFGIYVTNMKSQGPSAEMQGFLF